MPALVAGIHVLKPSENKDVDGRVKPGHDGGGNAYAATAAAAASASGWFQSLSRG